MLSKNNFKERLRKMEDRQDRFSIRKFSIGAASRSSLCVNWLIYFWCPINTSCSCGYFG
ncbi:YSIRK-type signal peptide-containing protein [Lactobacillus taiwanensis]|uniref:YSIRK-type signal peptide-containing protein n=1 Tax=Lactobacillus taiwanensis TaxID=508451 RepID=UPI00279619E1|nr:YSIRK-type signal peptide-containing protein [Lactobacillus taiwanensis]